ncbi:hypothetical protein GJ697_13175 [Pseudoduganella sp. FT25W]|uniref:Uncharacterized protein n=1 Tax=Duganella alba TaxID=2666081 RepID=A0A6L5QGN3_9BURK|nr:hypothetical protein [Duganella alba]MRX08790.1 hypothetical protein [Duganella alba]MRX18722.1 hypothetical protein [Duganella alba]
MSKQLIKTAFTFLLGSSFSLSAIASVDDLNAYRKNYTLRCDLVSEIVDPVRELAYLKFDKKKSTIVQNGEFTLYKYSPAPSLEVAIVLGDDEKKVLTNIVAQRLYLKKKGIDANHIRQRLALRAEDKLPTEIDCEHGTVKIIGGEKVEKLLIEFPID